MTRLDLSRTDTFFPAVWVVLKSCGVLCIGNILWYTNDIYASATPRVFAAFVVMFVVLEPQGDALFLLYACARGAFSGADSLRNTRVLSDVFIMALFVYAAPLFPIDGDVCTPVGVTCFAWAIFVWLLGVADCVGADALRTVCMICVVILSAVTATTPCFAVEYHSASFAHFALRFCAYVLCVITRCYVGEMRTAHTDKNHQRARLVPNIALFGWLFVANAYIVAACAVVCLCLCIWVVFGLSRCGVYVDECGVFRKNIQAPGDIETLSAPSLHLPMPTPSVAQLSATSNSILPPLQLNEDLAERLRSIEESVSTGRRRAGAAMFG